MVVCSKKPRHYLNETEGFDMHQVAHVTAALFPSSPRLHSSAQWTVPFPPSSALTFYLPARHECAQPWIKGDLQFELEFTDKCAM